MRILAGDLGGTKTLLMLAECREGKCQPIIEQRYRSGAFDGLGSMVEQFLTETGEEAPIAAACFGVAGPVSRTPHNETATITALPWSIDANELASRLAIGRVRLLNDFEAIGYGIEALAPEQLVELQQGEPQPHGTRAVLGAGTGLGIGLLLHNGDRYRPLPSEGGHADFAPGNPLQQRLQHHLWERYGHLSWDRLLSGPGLVAIYDFLTTREGQTPSPSLQHAMSEGDGGAAISRHAIEHGDPLAGEALELFVSLYGAQAGNIALTLLPLGGLYLAGGIAPQIIERLRRPIFLDAFHAKGRMEPLMHRFPIRVVMEPRVGLLGAALHAAGA